MNKKAPHTEYIEYKGLRIPFSQFLPLVIGFVLGVITTIGLLVWLYFNYYIKYYHSISKEDFDRVIQASIVQTQNALTPKTINNVQHPTETIVPFLQQLQITNTPLIRTIENTTTLPPHSCPKFYGIPKTKLYTGKELVCLSGWPTSSSKAGGLI